MTAANQRHAPHVKEHSTRGPKTTISSINARVISSAMQGSLKQESNKCMDEQSFRRQEQNRKEGLEREDYRSSQPLYDSRRQSCRTSSNVPSSEGGEKKACDSVSSMCNSVSMRRETDDITHCPCSHEAREKIDKLLSGSTINNLNWDFPKFKSEELHLGKFLGRGGFSNVEEIHAITVRSKFPRLLRSNSNALDDKESRAFIAQHCVRPSGDARYAMKKLRKEVIQDPKLFWAGMVDIANEICMLSHLEHPHIIKLRAVADCDPHSGDYFLVLDRLYDTLQHRLTKWKQRRERETSLFVCLLGKCKKRRIKLMEERLSAAFDLVSAIRYLHEKRICHRDIKPENIGFDIRGDIKLFDFGLARYLPAASEADEKGTYQLSHTTGSLRYMSPEVGMGRPYNHGCDVYSVSLVIWEILALERVFDKFRDEASFVQKVFHRGNRPPINNSWSKGCKALLARGWDGDVVRRLDIGEMKNILRSELIRVRCGDDLGLYDEEHERRRSTFVFKPNDSASGNF